MNPISDSMRRISLRAVGAGYATIDGRRIEPALFVKEPLESDFDGIRANAERPYLRVVQADAKAADVRQGGRVEIPDDDGQYFVAEVTPDLGFSLVELREE